MNGLLPTVSRALDPLKVVCGPRVYAVNVWYATRGPASNSHVADGYTQSVKL